MQIHFPTLGRPHSELVNQNTNINENNRQHCERDSLDACTGPCRGRVDLLNTFIPILAPLSSHKPCYMPLHFLNISSIDLKIAGAPVPDRRSCNLEYSILTTPLRR